MSRKLQVRQRRLNELEVEFEPLLLACLEECAQGRWGVFGRNDLADPEHRYWHWKEAERLKEIAEEIHSLSEEFGNSNALCERFLYYRSLRGANVKGEPRLARELLNEIASAKAQGAEASLL